MFTGAVHQGPPQTEASFTDLGLSEPIVGALDRIGFEHPTPIQAEVIPRGLDGVDVVGLAQTGSGKTAVLEGLSLLTPGGAFVRRQVMRWRVRGEPEAGVWPRRSVVPREKRTSEPACCRDRSENVTAVCESMERTHRPRRRWRIISPCSG